jgi:hypothetical protein
MNYNQIYQSLINRAAGRKKKTGEYYELHHIIPRCLGGTDSKKNLVYLTGREHYIAHLCLVKIYPRNMKLVKAAVMMCCESHLRQNRSGNRIYEWLRKKHQAAMSESQSGSKNSQYGKSWIFNPKLNREKKVEKEELDQFLEQGWQKGRTSIKVYTCVICTKPFQSRFEKKTCSGQCLIRLKPKFESLNSRTEEFLSLYKDLKSMNKALKAMGYKGAISHYYHWAKSVVDKSKS